MRLCYMCTSAGQPPNEALFEAVLSCRSNVTPLTCRSFIQPANDTGELGEGEGGEKSCLKRTCLIKSNHPRLILIPRLPLSSRHQ